MKVSIVRAAVLAVAALAALAGVALATGGGGSVSANALVTACAKKDGQIRVVADSAACKRPETVLRWNVAGPRGDSGPKGDQGPKGDPGPKGDAGAQGAAGSSGTAGGAGPAGPAGAAGERGATGPAGPAGPAGATGAQGPRGFDGPAGPPGARGADGAPGPTGPQGAKGDPGGAIASFGDLAGLPYTTSTATGTIALTFDAGGHATFTCAAATPPPPPSTVRVNEVATGTTGAASDEFVELFNAGAAAVDVGGWKVVYRSASGTSDTTLGTIPAGTSIAAGGFYLLGGSAYAGAATADQSFGTGLASTGGAVGVRDSTGALLDGVGWGTATNALVEGSAAAAPPATAAPGSSIVRLPDGHDTDANSSDLTVSSTATPRAANH